MREISLESNFKITNKTVTLEFTRGSVVNFDSRWEYPAREKFLWNQISRNLTSINKMAIKLQV